MNCMDERMGERYGNSSTSSSLLLREIGENRGKLGIENEGNNIIKKTLKVFFYSSMCSSLVMFLCVPATDNNTSMSQHLSEELASGCGK